MKKKDVTASGVDVAGGLNYAFACCFLVYGCYMMVLVFKSIFKPAVSSSTEREYIVYTTTSAFKIYSKDSKFDRGVFTSDQVRFHILYGKVEGRSVIDKLGLNPVPDNVESLKVYQVTY